MNKPIRKPPTVDDYMARELTTFRPEDSILWAIDVLLDRRYSGAPVVNESNRLVGMLSKKDCFKIVYSTSYHQDAGGRVADYMSQTVETVETGTGIVATADLFLKSPYRRFPVLHGSELLGQISRCDLLLALQDLRNGVR